MNKNVLGNAGFVTHGQCPNTEIVVFKISTAKALIQAANTIDNFSPRKETKTDQARYLQGLSGHLFSPLGGQSRHLRQIAVSDLGDPLRSRNTVRYRTDQPCVGILRENSEHSVKPAGGENSVIVQEHHRLAESQRKTLVISGCEPAIRLIGNDSN